MTPQQEAHLARLKSQFCARMDAKYRNGQQEHGGNLFAYDPLVLLDNAIAEVLDQWAYLQSLRDVLTGTTLDSADAAYLYDWSNGRPVPVVASTFCHVKPQHDHGSDDDGCRVCKEPE